MKDERKQPNRLLAPTFPLRYTQSTPKRRNKQVALSLLPVLFHYPPPGTI